MDKDQTYYERIHRYLSHDMTTAESTSFEKEISQSEMLRRDVQLEKHLLEGIARERWEDDFSGTLRNVRVGLEQSGYFGQQSRDIRRARRKKKLLWVSALALACLVIFYMAWPRIKKTPQPEKIFAAYFYPDTLRLYALYDDLSAYGLLETGNTPRRDSLRQSLAFYQQGAYAQAEKYLEDYLNQWPSDRQAIYALAMCRLALDKTAGVAELLRPLSKSADFEWRQEASWYLALCLVKHADTSEEGKAIMQRMSSDPDSPYQQGAARILLELN